MLLIKSLKLQKISDIFLLLAEREVSNYGESIIKSVKFYSTFLFFFILNMFYTEMLPKF